MKRLKSLAADTFWLLVAAAIIVGGYLGFQTLGALKTPVEATAVERTLPVVNAQALRPLDGPLPIRGEGFLRPGSEVGLGAQVSGRVVDLHPAVATRGRIAKGEVVARLDDRTARAQLERTEADIASVEANLALARTQAARNADLFQRGVISQDRLDQAQTQESQLAAQLIGLRSAQTSAQVQLDNTVIRAPFDARVLNQAAELGDVVNPGQTIATLISADALEVTIPLTPADAALVPGLFADTSDATATVASRFAGQLLEWPARIERVAPDLDPRTRTLAVTLRLADPSAPGQAAGQATGAGALPSGNPPALINSFVAVTIDGARLADVYAIPSTALRPEDTVWLVNDSDSVTIRSAEPVHVDGETTFVRIAPPPGAAERVITSALDSAVDGMRVVVAEPAALSARAAE